MDRPASSFTLGCSFDSMRKVREALACFSAEKIVAYYLHESRPTNLTALCPTRRSNPAATCPFRVCANRRKDGYVYITKFENHSLDCSTAITTNKIRGRRVFAWRSVDIGECYFSIVMRRYFVNFGNDRDSGLSFFSY